MGNTIAAVVHTYNSEKHLDAVLAALQGVDEILVCDMHSTDRTLAICERHGARVVFHENVGFAEPARNFAIGEARGDWILVVDSDEIVPPALIPWLREQIARPDCPDSFLLPVKNIIWGKALRAAYPDYHVRFFRKANFKEWPPFVHRGAVVRGRKFIVPAHWEHLALQHQSYESIEVFLTKMNRYTNFELEKLQRKGARFSLAFACWRAVGEFLKRYLLKGGFLDGAHGLIFAVMMAFYKFTALCKLWDAERRVRLGPADKAPETDAPVAVECAPASARL
jgi:glycosyltransferase involved in cell wall biosynthesis